MTPKQCHAIHLSAQRIVPLIPEQRQDNATATLVGARSGNSGAITGTLPLRVQNIMGCRATTMPQCKAVLQVLFSPHSQWAAHF